MLSSGNSVVSPKEKNQKQAQTEPSQTVSEPEPEIVRKAGAPLLSEKSPSKFSIKAALEKKVETAEKETSEPKEKLPSNHFTETDLQKEWNEFLTDLQKKDIIIFNAISSFRMKKLDEDTIQITYSSESARNEFEKIRGDFFNHFKRKVNHYNIKTEYSFDGGLKKEIITKRKIFDKFAEINPLLKELDDLFKFDFN